MPNLGERVNRIGLAVQPMGIGWQFCLVKLVVPTI